MSEEFLHFFNNPDSASSRGARLLGCSPEQFANWRWQMRHQLQTQADFAPLLELTEQEAQGFDAVASLFNVGVTPYYAALMQQQHSMVQPCPIRLQSLPQLAETTDAIGQADPLAESCQSPVREVVHIYPDRVAFCVAQICPVYCRYCFRKRRDEEEGLHFNRTIVDRGIAYIESMPAIRDVLITGGDPFLVLDEALVSLVERLRRIKHVDIIRFGTRTPVTLPYRVTEALAQKLKPFHPLWLNTHFNCVEEITAEAAQAVANLVNAGIPVGNQAVLLRGVNDTPDKMLALCRKLLSIRVRPYYVFHPHLISGSQHLRVPVDRGMAIMKSLRGHITGFGIPTYAIDTPSGKIPLQHQHILAREGSDLILEGLRGEIWREKHAFF